MEEKERGKTVESEQAKEIVDDAELEALFSKETDADKVDKEDTKEGDSENTEEEKSDEKRSDERERDSGAGKGTEPMSESDGDR